MRDLATNAWVPILESSEERWLILDTRAGAWVSVLDSKGKRWLTRASKSLFSSDLLLDAHLHCEHYNEGIECRVLEV